MGARVYYSQNVQSTLKHHLFMDGSMHTHSRFLSNSLGVSTISLENYTFVDGSDGVSLYVCVCLWNPK